MKYYYREHLSGYQKMLDEGKISWGGISYHAGVDDLDHFSSREFLENILPRLSFVAPHIDVFELGTGTGPVACYLAVKGYHVDAIDLIPTAIEVARQIALGKGLDINYQVLDACQIPTEGKPYDLIVDSYCLQGIVLDQDRRTLFSAIQSRLKPDGYYLISTSVGQRKHRDLNRDSFDHDGHTYIRDDQGDLWDLTAGIYYKSFKWYSDLEDAPQEYDDAIEVQGQWFAPNRRLHTATSLASELGVNGFDVLYQGEENQGDIVCKKKGAQVRLLNED